MIRTALVLASMLFAVVFSSSVFGQLESADRAVIDRYKSALAEAKSGTGKIEAAFSTITSVSDALMRNESDEGVLLENLSEYDFLALERELEGIWINREETVYVKPNPEYWARLAEERGEQADKAFFNALKTTYPSSIWPVYLEPQTDYSGCTRFGSMKLVDTYGLWTKVETEFPDNYKAAVAKEIERVKEELISSSCVCGRQQDVVKELETFLVRFPRSSHFQELKSKLDLIKKGFYVIYERCQSG